MAPLRVHPTFPSIPQSPPPRRVAPNSASFQTPPPARNCRQRSKPCQMLVWESSHASAKKSRGLSTNTRSNSKGLATPILTFPWNRLSVSETARSSPWKTAAVPPRSALRRSLSVAAPGSIGDGEGHLAESAHLAVGPGRSVCMSLTAFARSSQTAVKTACRSSNPPATSPKNWICRRPRNEPHGIAVSSTGDFYISFNQAVLKYDPSGNLPERADVHSRSRRTVNRLVRPPRRRRRRR